MVIWFRARDTITQRDRNQYVLSNGALLNSHHRQTVLLKEGGSKQIGWSICTVLYISMSQLWMCQDDWRGVYVVMDYRKHRNSIVQSDCRSILSILDTTQNNLALELTRIYRYELSPFWWHLLCYTFYV